jgi:hypothetical protein
MVCRLLSGSTLLTARYWLRLLAELLMVLHNLVGLTWLKLIGTFCENVIEVSSQSNISFCAIVDHLQSKHCLAHSNVNRRNHRNVKGMTMQCSDNALLFVICYFIVEQWQSGFDLHLGNPDVITFSFLPQAQSS